MCAHRQSRTSANDAVRADRPFGIAPRPESLKGEAAPNGGSVRVADAEAGSPTVTASRWEAQRRIADSAREVMALNAWLSACRMSASGSWPYCGPSRPSVQYPAGRPGGGFHSGIVWPGIAYRVRRKPSTRWIKTAAASAPYDGSELSAK
jgi:hypothetical protein